MNFFSFKRTVATLLVVLAALQGAAWLGRLYGFDLPPTIEPVLPALTSLALLAYWRESRLNRRAKLHILSQREKLRQESVALNRHAMVVMTDTEGFIYYANDKFLDATGYTQEDLLGTQADILYFEEDKPRHAWLSDILAKGGTWEGENRLRLRDGSEMWTNLTILPGIDAHGHKHGAISVGTDITDARRMRSNKVLFEALDRLSDEVFIFDLESLNLRYCNFAAADSHSFDQSQSRDMNLAQLHPVYSSEAFTQELARLSQGPLTGEPLDIEKGKRVFEARLQILEETADGPEVLAVLHDVTAKREAERVRGEFISTVSHELRSPMTSIKGAMGLLLAGTAGPVPEKAHGMLSIAHRNADRLINIINDLLDIEKIAAGRMTFDLGKYDLAALIDEAIVTNASYSQRFDVQIDREGIENGVAFIDFERSLQVLNNLISNATKFSHPGGRVVIRLEQEDNQFAISVQDFGKGIPASKQGEIFDKFVQVGGHQENGVRGTGLGLAIAKAIVEQQQGTVTFESTEGVGTTFRATFPEPNSIADSSVAPKNNPQLGVVHDTWKEAS